MTDAEARRILRLKALRWRPEATDRWQYENEPSLCVFDGDGNLHLLDGETT